MRMMKQQDDFDIYDVEQGILTGKAEKLTKGGKYELVSSALDGRPIGIVPALPRPARLAF
jgi:hypothetical protein